MTDCLPQSTHRERLPTMKEAIEIVTMQWSRKEQGRQLSYMRQTQGDEFAETVYSKVKASGGVKAK